MKNRQTDAKPVQDDKFLNALADAFRLHEAIINTTELAIFSTTVEGIVTSFNQAAERMLGYSEHEVIDKSSALAFLELDEVIRRAEKISSKFNIEAEPVFDALTFRAREKKMADRAEWMVFRKDGSQFPALLSLSALRDDNDTLTGFVVIITDLSEQKQNEETAAINEQKFRLLAENVPGVIYLCHNDADYSMIFINDRIESVTGYPSEDFLNGKIHFSNIFHPEDAEMVYRGVDEALSQRKSFHLQYRIRHRSGEWRWVDEVGIGVYSDDKLLMLEGFISDITTQKNAEEKLQKVAVENLRVFNNPVNLNVVAGMDGYFKRLNSSWTRVLGWSLEELQSRPFIHFVHPDDVESTNRANEQLGYGNPVFTFENRYRCKDGSYRWLLWGSSPDLKGQLIYASAIDITERKKSEEALLHSKKNLESIAGKLQEQNRQLDEFAHIISHNFRSPLSNIHALIGLLGENSTIDDYKLIFDKLKNVSKNLNETMNDLMDTLKVRNNTNVERVDLRFKEVLDKIVQSLEGDLIMTEASLTFDFNQATNIVYPKPYMESIFQNLLSNALKYRSPKRRPKIHFETRYVNDVVELRVSDNGLGIDMERFGDKVFGLHKTFHPHAEARGVGLFLIKTQIEAMGGSIAVESKIDEGTTFIIQFNH